MLSTFIFKTFVSSLNSCCNIEYVLLFHERLLYYLKLCSSKRIMQTKVTRWRTILCSRKSQRLRWTACGATGASNPIKTSKGFHRAPQINGVVRSGWNSNTVHLPRHRQLHGGVCQENLYKWCFLTACEHEEYVHLCRLYHSSYSRP